MTTATQTRRLFFALWPDDQVRDAILDASASVSVPPGSRLIAAENFHITLHFVGRVSQEVQHCLHHAASAIQHQPFLITLDCFGHFKAARIGWMGCQRPPAELFQLHHQLAESLVDCSYQTELRQYQPHLTLLRRCEVPVATPKDFVIRWPVEAFALVESISGAHGVNYQVIEKYPLA